MTKCPILGGWGVGRSQFVSDSHLVNMYLEFIDDGDGREPGTFYMTPGLTLLKSVGSGPINGLHVMGTTLFVVSGSTLYSVAPDLTVSNLGSLGSPIVTTMIDNGTQLAIFTGIGGYLYGPTYALSTITVDVPGSYATTPSISFTGGGGSGGGTATATLGAGFVASVTVSNGGSGWITAPTVVFTGGSGSGAAGTAIVTGGVIVGVSITNPGNGYVSAPSVSFTAGSGAAGTVTTSGGIVTGVTLSSGGSGYLAAPTVTISGGGGTGATATASISGGVVTGITITSAGSGYSGTPTVSFAVGSGAVATAVMNFPIASIAIGVAGAYNSAPSVVITGGGGSGGGSATATLSGTSLGNTLSSITLPFSFPLVASYQDGFGLVAQLNTNTIWQSNLLDLSTWDALNFSEADSTPTFINGMYEKQREQWIFKTDCVEVWINAGLSGFAFQRLQGVFVEQGCAAPQSIAKSGNSLLWLSENKTGFGKVYIATGYEPQKVSTHAVEFVISQAVPLSSATAYVYSDSGHDFYCLTLPNYNSGAGITLCLDITETQKAGFPVWHQRATGTGYNFSRHPGQVCQFWDRELQGYSAVNVVGDYQNGNLYFYDDSNFLDNGASRQVVRSFRATKEQSYIPRQFDSLQIDMQTGVSVTGSPTIELSWSDDGGSTYTTPQAISAGTSGQTGLMIKFNALGSTSQNRGLDRIFRLGSTMTSTASYQIAITGADVQP